MDRAWGHLVIKMAGHAPFGAQVILNGHEYVAVAAQAGDRFHQGGELLTRKLGPRWARGSEPWPVRWQGCGMALVVRRAMAGVPGRRRLRCWGNQGLRLLAGR